MTIDDADATRARLEALLGLARHVPARRDVRTDHVEDRQGYRLARMEIEGIPALLTRPLDGGATVPVVLYVHAHGNRYDIGKRELTDGRASLQAPPYAAALAGIGMAALCLDLPCFGARAGEGESARAKRRLWEGGTLFGDMLRDLQTGLDALAVIEGIDARRIGVLGLSMGATLGFWLAALDGRVAALAHLCCFCDLETLVAGGGHDLHGIYMTVPGLLRAVPTGRIAGLVAPRPQLCGVGLRDPLTPALAVTRAAAATASAYAAHGAADAWTLVADPDGGHRETPEMRRTVLEFLARTLGRPS
jgi:pimeloyl-ACP methyl ester carboxylesterase